MAGNLLQQPQKLMDQKYGLLHIKHILLSPLLRLNFPVELVYCEERGWDLGGTPDRLISLDAFHQVFVPTEKNLQDMDLVFLPIILLEAPLIVDFNFIKTFCSTFL